MAGSLGKRILKVVGIVVVVLVVLVVVIRMVAPGIAVAVVNKQLPKALNAEASIGDIDLSLVRGRVRIEDIHIAQPKGFRGDAFLDVGVVRLDIKPQSVAGSLLIVQEVVLEDVMIGIVKNKEGKLNTAALVAEKKAGAESEPEKEVVVAADKEPASPILIRKIVVRNLNFSYLDESSGEPPLHVRIANLNLGGSKVYIDSEMARRKILPGAIELTATLDQSPLPDGQLGLSVVLGAVGEAVPALNAVVRVVGLELKSLSAVVPHGIAATLGGDCVDIYVDAAVAPDVLEVNVTVATAGSSLPLHIGGTPDKPLVDKSGALFGVAGRLGGGVFNVAEGAAGAALEAGDMAMDTTMAVGKGATKVVGKVGGGLFKAARGVLTGDLKGVTAGVKEGTVGAIDEAVDTAKDATGEVVEGTKEAAAASVNTEDADNWRKGVPERWRSTWQEAVNELADRPYPTPLEKGSPLDLLKPGAE